ncbi:MAG: aminotransferase class V-fold PLP-dependent enzyme [Gemmatimonadota bacterium]|nr:aminotransferase class V-fold PLP-dependent enzyme [Gemmatimonadota bacterium]MDH5759593.1 aminotransferase class V-fold PLP-dependent enzyme [Gemmatimonadota bacterium]
MDIHRLRSETPGCAHRVHLNNAGASLAPDPVLERIRAHLDLESRVGGYEAEAEAAPAIEESYRHMAALLGTEARNVAFTEHATASFVQALSAVPFEPGDVILTTRHDYVSNQIQYISLGKRMGVEVVRAPDAPEGGVDVQALADLVRTRRPRLVAMTHIPTNSGLVQDVAAVGRVCREHEVLFLVDACQSLGQMPVRPGEIGCHFLSATARKFLRGPRGAGVLWVSDDVLEGGMEPLFPDLRSADWVAPDRYVPAATARRFETWEFAWALVLGTGEAARYAGEVGLEAIRTRVSGMAADLRERLAGLPGVRVLDRGPELCAIVTAQVRGWRPPDLVMELRRRGINTTGQSRVDAVIDYDAKESDGALRISPHYFNTDDEIAAVVGALAELTGE